LVAVELGARARGATVPAWNVTLAVLLATVSGVAGLVLWRGLPLGRWASLAVQALQLVQFELRAGTYAFVAGLKLAVFATSSLPLGTNYGFLGTLTLGRNGAVAAGLAPSWVGVNLAALAAIVFLLVDGGASRPDALPSRPPA
jgi:hypothetical protein